MPEKNNDREGETRKTSSDLFFRVSALELEIESEVYSGLVWLLGVTKSGSGMGLTCTCTFLSFPFLSFYVFLLLLINFVANICTIF